MTRYTVVIDAEDGSEPPAEGEQWGAGFTVVRVVKDESADLAARGAEVGRALGEALIADLERMTEKLRARRQTT